MSGGVAAAPCQELATARQLGSALGVAAFVAAAGGRRASDLGGSDRAWIIVVITAAITAVAGQTTGRRIAVREVAAKAETAENTAAIACGTSPTGVTGLTAEGFDDG